MTLAMTLALGLLLPLGQAVPAVDEAAARRVIEAWAAAQSQGDLPAYQALYAPTFVGIKNNGPTPQSLDRAAWLTEREAVFKKQQKVQAQDLKVEKTAAGFRVTFTQVYEAGRYKNSNSKVMELVSAPSGLLIAREELARPPAPSPAPAGPPKADDGTPLGIGSRAKRDQLHLAFVEQRRAILARDMGRYDAGELPEERYSGWQSGSHVSGPVERRKVQALPKRFAQLAGTAISVLGASGQVLCSAKLGELSLMFMYPYEGGLGGPDRPSRPQFFLTADLDGMTKECAEKASFVRAAALPPLKPVAAEPLSGALNDRVAAGLRKTKAYESAAESAKQARKRPKSFLELSGQVLRLPSGEAYADMSYDGESCKTGDQFGWALWRLKGSPEKPTLSLLNEESDKFDGLQLAADVDGDGQVEVLTGRGQITADGYEEWLPDMHVSWPAGLGCDGM